MKKGNPLVPRRITVCLIIGKEQAERLTALARLQQTSVSALAREAFELFLSHRARYGQQPVTELSADTAVHAIEPLEKARA